MNSLDAPSSDLRFPRGPLGSVNEHYPLFDGGRLLAAALLCLVLGSWISLVHKGLREPSAAPHAPALAQPEQQR